MAWDIIGHDWAVSQLRRSLASGRVAHAHLFTGPPQIGKTTLALALARALNCGQPEPPCGQCPSCRKALREIHPDIRVMRGSGVDESIKIDQFRELQREAALTPYEGRYRVAVVRRADKATPETANSLLKTLEEPPPHVVLILTASNPEALPTTVLSRCQRLDLEPVTREVIEAALVSQGLAPDQAHLLARLSGGRVGWALEAVRKPALLEQHRQHVDQFVALLGASRVERLRFAASKPLRDVEVASRYVELWTTWWRDLLLACAGNVQHVLNVDRMDEFRLLAPRTSLDQVRDVLEALRETAARLEVHVNTQLAMEGLLLRLPYWP